MKRRSRICRGSYISTSLWLHLLVVMYFLLVSKLFVVFQLYSGFVLADLMTVGLWQLWNIVSLVITKLLNTAAFSDILLQRKMLAYFRKVYIYRLCSYVIKQKT
jgi:hypothetical protein